VEDVTMIGQGWNREPTLTEWTASWTESPPGPAVYSGYKRAAGRTMRWGRDVVTETGLLVETGSNSTRSFVTYFDEVGGLADEAHVAEGDSGGAAFVKRNGEWELAGILFARYLHPDQPIDTVVFGNETIAVELSFYRDQILDATAPGIPALLLPAGAALAGLLIVSARRALRLRSASADERAGQVHV
jgi:hypothetical protein